MKYSGGNPYCPRETPAWQKPITQFFQHHDKDFTEDKVNSAEVDENDAGGSDTS